MTVADWCRKSLIIRTLSRRRPEVLAYLGEPRRATARPGIIPLQIRHTIAPFARPGGGLCDLSLNCPVRNGSDGRNSRGVSSYRRGVTTMRRLALALLASTSLLGLASVAEAADLAIRKAPPPPPPPPLWSWTGFYVGAHIGAGQSRKEFTTKDPFCFDFFNSQDGFVTGFENSKRGSHNAIGGLGGVQAGFNWQAGVIVFGVEAQYSWARLKGDHRIPSASHSQTSLTTTISVSSADTPASPPRSRASARSPAASASCRDRRIGRCSTSKAARPMSRKTSAKSTRGTDFDCFDDNCFSTKLQQ